MKKDNTYYYIKKLKKRVYWLGLETKQLKLVSIALHNLELITTGNLNKQAKKDIFDLRIKIDQFFKEEQENE